MDFAITLELSPAIQRLDALRLKQLPFATALALTRTAEAARAELRAELPKRFTLRNRFVEQGIRIEPATKRKQSAAVFWRAPGGAGRRAFADLLARQEVGGRTVPKGRYTALPRAVKRSGSGLIPRSQRPRALLQRKNVFVEKLGNRGAAIVQRVGRGRSATLRVLYRLTTKPSVYRPRWEFRATAERVARKTFRKEFGAAFARAIASGRG